jgi:hypothetical protein
VTTEEEFEKFRDDLMEDMVLMKNQADLLVQTQAAAAALAHSQAVAAAAAAAAANLPPATPTSGGATSMLSAYKMKRMYTDYKDIQKRHFFTQWFKEVKVTAHTHNCVNPLNPNYVATLLSTPITYSCSCGRENSEIPIRQDHYPEAS